jgi:type IV pilus assembly protein PilV
MNETRHAAKFTGASLLEVLIAVFILSVGMLGAAGLQVTSKRANLEARQRVTATTLAQDIVERMRANATELTVYTDAGLGLTITGADMAAIDCSAGCTTAQIAALDLYEWEQALAGVMEQIAGASVGGLMAPTACITGPAGGSGVYTIAVAWRGATALSDPGLNGCGQGSGRYDSNDGAAADVHRRLLVVTTYIAEPT